MGILIKKLMELTTTLIIDTNDPKFGKWIAWTWDGKLSGVGDTEQEAISDYNTKNA